MEVPERTLIVGRSPDADVTLADPSLAPRHAELVVTSSGRLHLTDCASATGTWLLSEAGEWQRVRQVFVRPDSRVRLGEHVCLAADLVAGPAARTAAAAGVGGERGGSLGRGRIERDPATGEIVRRRF